MDIKTFLGLPDDEFAQHVRQKGARVCVFPINGTRRWFLLEHGEEAGEDPISTYMDVAGRRNIELFRMIFDHGVDTLLSPMFGHDLMERGEAYIERVGADGLARLARHPDFLSFYQDYGVRVRFYGDYRRYLEGTPFAWLLDAFDEVTRLTSQNDRCRLMYGVFANDASETTAKLGIDYFQKRGCAPDRRALVEMYYGEFVEPVSFFIGFDRLSAYDMPLLATGSEDLYFTLSPSPYLTRNQLRCILHDHLYTRRTMEQDYAALPVGDLSWMRSFYAANREQTLGVGAAKGAIWYPVGRVVWPGAVEVEQREEAAHGLGASHSGQRIETFEQLLTQIGPGRMTENAYDTAWAARLVDADKEMANQALQWICENQLPDGSWGAAQPLYYHDRVVCTLAAMTMLARRGKRASDRKQMERGLAALEKIATSASEGLQKDPNGATVGFEMIVPSLVAEAESLGIMPHHGDKILRTLAQLRQAKLARLGGHKINRTMTAAFSAEMAGRDVNMLDVDRLQEVNGSVAHSPSATAYFAGSIRPQDEAALAYLRKIITPQGGFPNVAPFDLFEPAWTLWNLALAGPVDDRLLKLCQPHLDYLVSAWKPGVGIATWVAKYVPADGDDTGMVYEVLSRYGRAPDPEALFHWEEAGYFRCFEFEANPSVSTNIHILGALRQVGCESGHPAVRKIIHFLRSMRISDAYWFDKWHASPYYATAHAVIACAEYESGLAASAIDWLLSTQRKDGSWGYYLPTAEETAYALQALCCWQRSGGRVPKSSIERGAGWLEDHVDPPYPPLWIGKCLYSPYLVVLSSILSALTLSRG